MSGHHIEEGRFIKFFYSLQAKFLTGLSDPTHRKLNLPSVQISSIKVHLQ